MIDEAGTKPSRNGHGPMFGVEVCSDAARSWVTVSGELDLASTPRLQRVLDGLCRDGCQEIVLDLAELEFLSAVGLGLFVRADEQFRAAGGRLILNRPRPVLRRILAITELDTVLTIRPVLPCSLDRAAARESSQAS
ncbi:MAG: STAS domain-containing protein [Pseudonocardiaceae bacterium]